MASRRPLVESSGGSAEIPTGDSIPIAVGGTGATTAASALSNLGAQAALGYTPVQQGTGVGQLPGNAIKIGWTGQYLRATVDTTDLGRVWADVEAARSLSASGYQRLPSSLIIQWGLSSSSTDVQITLPVTFPTAFVAAFASLNARAATNLLFSTTTAIDSLSAFTVYKRLTAGGSVGTPGEGFYWFAIGY